MDIDLLLATPHYIVERTKREHARRWCPELRGHVVDIGCGYSPYRHLLSQASRYTAIETEWRYRPDVLALATSLPLRSESVDSVMLTEVLEHLPDPERALREIARVLLPEGRLYLTVPMTWGLHYEPHDYYRFTRFGIAYLLEKTGFRVEAIEPMGGLFTIIAARLAECFATLAVDRPLRRIGVERGRLRACALALLPYNVVAYPLCKILDKIWDKDVFGWAVLARKAR
jgi:SAM-dependent methyltransferase